MYSQSWISAAREDKRWASLYKTSLGLLLLMPETLDQGQPHPEHWHQQAEQNQKLWGAWLNCHTCQHQNTASSQTPLTSQVDLPHSDAYSFFKYHKIYLPLSIHMPLPIPIIFHLGHCTSFLPALLAAPPPGLSAQQQWSSQNAHLAMSLHTWKLSNVCHYSQTNQQIFSIKCQYLF